MTCPEPAPLLRVGCFVGCKFSLLHGALTLFMFCFDCGFDLRMWLGSDPDFHNLVPGRRVHSEKEAAVWLSSAPSLPIQPVPSMDSSWVSFSVKLLGSHCDHFSKALQMLAGGCTHVTHQSVTALLGVSASHAYTNLNVGDHWLPVASQSKKSYSKRLNGAKASHIAV